MWSGLGYNNRAKRLYETSKILEKKGFDQIYPNFDVLPGVGPYTKNAILSFAYGKKVLAVDTNIERVIQRYFGLDDTKDFFRENSKYLLSKVDSRDLNQAFMDFGSSICNNLKPLCTICPIEKNCKKYFSKNKNSNEKLSGMNAAGGLGVASHNMMMGGYGETISKPSFFIKDKEKEIDMEI